MTRTDDVNVKPFARRMNELCTIPGAVFRTRLGLYILDPMASE